MRFLLIGFHSVGKVSNCCFFYNLLPIFFQVWPIKQILTLFLYCFQLLHIIEPIRLNNAVIIVWVFWYGCQTMVCMCVIKIKMCAFL